MSLAFYFDHHVPGAIRDGLRRRQINVLSTGEDGGAAWADEVVLVRPTQLGRLVFTQDSDFLVIASDWAMANRQHAGIVNGHQLQITIGQAIRDLELIALIMDAIEMANRVEFLPLR